ncbi:hypothetical protein Dalk_2610 [Desulfatibacillum aliphaticivorans]|uniref:Uncharacterized protein n=1 Tax=Desulfatibacillum aliphaticivorans TaxID=218208 RepID=B8FIR2_DESAL|nr:hypothetical protein Dalk_2610 [Desulfatibacillum aliphaticivorans]
MKERRYTHGMTVFLSPGMHEQMTEVAHQKRISKGQLIREALSIHLRHYVDESGDINNTTFIQDFQS